MIKIGDIISYFDMCSTEGCSLQKGMNFHVKGKNTVILMSVQPNAPYADKVEQGGKVLIYEGHNVPKLAGSKVDPYELNQEMYNLKGSLTENGKFYQAAHLFKENSKKCEKVKVYEKIRSGIWVYNGLFDLIDAWQEKSNNRIVFKFKLVLSNEQKHRKVEQEFEHTRIIPTNVKQLVWARDKGKCVLCGSKTNLQYDHIIPYSKGGSSLTPENIQLLCAKCNSKKRDKIE